MMDWSWMGNPHSRQWQATFLVGTWLAGVGTIVLAAVTYWLARRDRRVDLKLIAVLGNPVQNHAEGQVLLRVWNVGRREAIVSAIGFQAGLFPEWSPIWPKQNIVVLPPPSNFRSRLNDGGEMGRDLPFDPLVVNLAGLLPRPAWLSVWTLRFWALTTIDEPFSARVRGSLRVCVRQMKRELVKMHKV